MNVRALSQPLEEVTGDRSGTDPLGKLEKTIHKHFMSTCDQLCHISVASEGEKSLITLHAEVQKYNKANGARRAFLDALSISCVRLLWQIEWDARVLKKIIKVMMCLDFKCSDTIQEELQTSVWTWEKQNIEISTISKWSVLLVSCDPCRRLVSENIIKFLGPTALLGKFRELLSLQSPTVSEQALAQMLIKVNLQCFQLLPNIVDSSWWQLGSEKEASQPNKQDDGLKKIILCLFKTLKTQVLGNESTLLSGTAVAFFLTLNTVLPSRAKCIVDIFLWLKENKPQVIGTRLVLEADESASDSTLAEIAYLGGILACAKEDILREKWDGDCIAMWLFGKITTLCYGVHQYPAFQLMLQWYNKMSVITSKGECLTLFSSESSQVVKDTMSLIWTHLDSPVDGVNQIVIEIFNMLIKCLKTVTPSERNQINADNHIQNAVMSVGDGDAAQDPCQNLVEDALVQISQMSWHVKGKHKIAAAVLPLVPLDNFFTLNLDLYPHLLECMGTNYLSPCATDFFKALIQAAILQNHHADDIDKAFMKFCAPPLIRGLTNRNCAIRQNVNMLWLSWTLKTLPSAYKLLLEKIKSTQTLCDDTAYSLQAIVSLYKCARNQDLISEVPLEILFEALSHPDDKMRIDGFSLICITNKKSEPLATWELETLKKFLPLNMNMDNAPFRHQLQACLRPVLVRARDSSLADLRALRFPKDNISTDDLPERLLPTLRFVQVVWEISIYSLHLATSFQRLKTSLDWISVILDIFTHQPGRHLKKGNTPEAVCHLLSFANKFELLQFFNEESSHILLSCIFHGTDQVREMAADLLLQYFPWPLPMATDETMISSIVRTGLELSLSPKPYQSEAGALLMKLIFCKCLQESRFEMTLADVTSVRVSKPEDGIEPGLNYLSQLTAILGDCVRAARGNVLVAAQSKPAHGIVIALRRCLSETNIQISQTEDWRTLFVQLRSLLVDLLDLCLAVLGGRLHGEDTAPSFEQMGVSIQAAVAESLVEQPTTDDPVLSTNYQIIASWCWVNVKEISMLFCHLVDMAVDSLSGAVVMGYEDIEEIGNLYFRVLTQCRHRGAIEGCNAGFTKYCTKLLFSSAKELTSIPRKLLNKVIDQVKGCSNVAASITRRSAGLPLIVLSIVTAESKTKQGALLKCVVETLIEVIAVPVEPHLDENRDLPQVHALNILKAVFRESSVSTSNMQHLGTAAVVTIQCFSSPYWAVRNAAIQLYETLLQRMLGQKKTREDRLTTQTVQEFFTHFPNMQGFVMEHMKQAGVQHQLPGWQLHPSLFPILTFLTKLTSGPLKLSESVRELKTVVTSMKSSPILTVREMSAQAILPLVQKDEVAQVIMEILNGIPATPQHGCFNDIHGSLLLITRLIQSQDGSKLSAKTKDAVIQRIWLMQSEKNPCALVRLAYVKAAMLLFDKLGLALHEEITKGLEKEALHELGLSNITETVQPGKDQYSRFLVDWWLTNCPPKDLAQRVQCCVRHEDVDVKESVLLFVFQKVSDERWLMVDWRNIMDILSVMVCKAGLPCKVSGGTLQLIMSIYKSHPVNFTQGQREMLWRSLMNLINREINSQSSALSIGLSAVLAKEYLQEDKDWEHLLGWTELLLECSDPLKAETVRLQTALALTVISPQLMQCCSKWNIQKKQMVYWNVYYCTCQLLMDENINIREQAAKVKLWITDQDFELIHPNLALDKLVEGFVSESQSFDQLFLLKKALENIPDLCGAIKDDSNKVVNDLFESEDVNPYLEDYVVMQLELHYLKRCSLVAKCDVCEKIGNCVQVLQDALPVLEKECSDPLNITCHRATFRCLWQCFHILQMSTLSQLPSHLCDEIKEFIKAYSGLKHLHPVLKRKLHQISVI